MTYVIEGAPRTKKTSNRILRFGKFNKIVPSKAYLDWRDDAVPQLREQGVSVYACPVNVRATVYRDAYRGDLIGYLQGIADALQEAGVIVDDKFITGWDGSRMTKDSKRPRVELEIVEMAP
jgi:Holliday junction resolvase RusA-like endonuclease